MRTNVYRELHRTFAVKPTPASEFKRDEWAFMEAESDLDAWEEEQSDENTFEHAFEQGAQAASFNDTDEEELF